MRVGVIGAGRIGGNAGRLLARAGHEVMFSFARSNDSLAHAVSAAGEGAGSGAPADAVAFGDVVVFSVPWIAIDDALREAGPLTGKVVIDTTNQFGPEGIALLPGGASAAEFNSRRMSGARYVKTLNTLTAGFQAEAAERRRGERVAMFLAGEDEDAKRVVSDLIADMGFEPVDVGGLAEVWIMEAPRREGAVYGEEYRPQDARKIAAVARDDPERASRLARALRVQE